MFGDLKFALQTEQLRLPEASEIKAVVPLAELLASPSRLLAEFPREFAGYETLRDDGSSVENGSGVTAKRRNRPETEETIRDDSTEPEND